MASFDVEVGGGHVGRLIQAETYNELTVPVAAPTFPQFVGVPDRNANFVGREGQLAALAADDATTSVLTQTISGLGGVGKTALAVELCHRSRGDHDVVRWLTGDSRELLVDGYLGTAAAVGVSIDGLSTDDGIARVRHWLETTERRWLLVFDNCDDPDVVRQLLPTSGNGRVIVTSRHQDWAAHGITPLRIGVLDPAEARELFVKRSGRADDPDLDRLLRHLGHLALAVEQAAAFVRATGISCDRYRAQLEQRAETLLADNSARLRRASGDDLTVLSVWDTSVERITAESPLALNVLNVLAYCAPDFVPTGLFVAPVAEDEADLAGGDEIQVMSAFATLANYSLVEAHPAEGGGFWAVSVHRLVQDMARVRSDTDRWLACATSLLASGFPVSTVRPDVWPLADALVPHVVTVAAHLEAHPGGASTTIPDLAAPALLVAVGTFLMHRGEPVRAVGQLEHAMDLVDREDDVAVSTVRRALARAYWTLGRTVEALEIEEDLLVRAERLFGPGSIEAVVARSDLAVTFDAQGRTAEALAMLEEAERSAIALGDDERAALLNVQMHKSFVLMHRGRVSEAVALLERVTEETEADVGRLHPATLISRSSLAAMYLDAGRPAEAAPLIEEQVANFEAELGAGHPQTLLARNTLAGAYLGAGRARDALALMEGVVADLVAAFGEHHPDVLTARHNLAGFLGEVGRRDEAIELQRAVVDERMELLGPTHPDTLMSRMNLASYQREVGDPAVVAAALAEVHRDIHRALGPEHPLTLTARANLASSLGRLGDPGAAVELYRELVEVRRRVLGDRHPDTLNARGNLAANLLTVGAADEAATIAEAALAGFREVFGPEHPTVFWILGLLIGARRVADASLASELAEEWITFGWRVLAPDDPELVDAEDLAVRLRSEVLGADAAMAAWAEHLGRARAALGPDHLQVLRREVHFASVAEDGNRLPDARAALEHLTAQDLETLAPQAPELLDSCELLAGLHARAQRWQLAELLLVRWVQALEGLYGPDDESVAAARSILAQVRARGRA